MSYMDTVRAHLAKVEAEKATGRKWHPDCEPGCPACLRLCAPCIEHYRGPDSSAWWWTESDQPIPLAAVN